MTEAQDRGAPLIQLRGVTKRYGSGAAELMALKGIDLDIAAGASTASAKQVWVLRDGAAVAVAVTPGITDGHMTEITGGELQAGMLVITDQKVAAAK